MFIKCVAWPKDVPKVSRIERGYGGVFSRSVLAATEGQVVLRGSHDASRHLAWVSHLTLNAYTKIGASGPHRLEIQFPFDLDLWH